VVGDADPVTSAATVPGDDEPETSSDAVTGESLVASELVVLADHVEPGKPFDVAIVFTCKPNWHLYWKNAGDSGAPPTVAWTLPEGFKAEALRFPVPSVHDVPGEKTYVHDGTMALVATIVPPSAPTGVSAQTTLKAELVWMTCKDVCLVGRRSHEVTVPREATAESTVAFKTANARLKPLLAQHPKASLSAIGALAELDRDSALILLPPKSMTASFIPADTPGVVYGDARMETTPEGRRALRIPFTLKPQDSLGKPLSVAGLVILESPSSAPIAAEFALAPQTAAKSTN
jgi:DsbC/DsbD-like thiol-disulfide interchange protein